MVCNYWFGCIRSTVASENVQGLGQYGSSVCQTKDSMSPHPSSKKGIGVWQMPTLEANIASANVSWFYAWGPCIKDFCKPANTEFVPMIWGLNDLSINLKNLQDTTQHQHLLTFNEVILSNPWSLCNMHTPLAMLRLGLHPYE